MKKRTDHFSPKDVEITKRTDRELLRAYKSYGNRKEKCQKEINERIEKEKHQSRPMYGIRGFWVCNLSYAQTALKRIDSEMKRRGDPWFSFLG